MPYKGRGFRLLARFFLWAVGLGLLGHVLWANRLSARQVLAHRPDGRYLALAFALGLAALVSTFVRWWLLVRVQGLSFRFKDAIRVGFVGNAVDLIVPGQVGGDMVKAAFLYRTQERRTRAVASILIDRGVGILGLFVLAGVMGAVNWPVSGADVRRLIVVVWGAVLAGTVGLVAALTPALIRPFDRLARHHGRIRSLIAELHAVSQTYRDHKAGVLLGLAMSTSSHALLRAVVLGRERRARPHPPSLRSNSSWCLVLFTTVIPLPFGAWAERAGKRQPFSADRSPHGCSRDARFSPCRPGRRLCEHHGLHGKWPGNSPARAGDASWEILVNEAFAIRLRSNRGQRSFLRGGFQRLDHGFDHGVGDPRIDADPKGLVHDEIGVVEVADPAMRNPGIGGLPQQVAAEDQTRGDLCAGSGDRTSSLRPKGAPVERRSGTRTSLGRSRASPRAGSSNSSSGFSPA